MGQGFSVFQHHQLEEYCDCTYFTGKDIIRLYKKFSQLNPDKLNPRIAEVKVRLSFEEVISGFPELRENPFADRICEVFSTDGKGLHFEDILDMFSVFSARAPWDLKVTYAFRIYDFNGDAALCRDDIENVIGRLTGDSLHTYELAAIAAGVFQEADIAKNQHLTFAEFEHVISRAPDFVNLFHVTI